MFAAALIAIVITNLLTALRRAQIEIALLPPAAPPVHVRQLNPLVDYRHTRDAWR
jgi:hypothetical protein